MAKEKKNHKQDHLSEEMIQPLNADTGENGLNKVIHDTHDEFGVTSRVLSKHGDILRFQTDAGTLLVHDGARYGEHPHRVGHLVKAVIDDIAQEFNPEALNVTTDHKGINLEDVDKFLTKIRKYGTVKQTLNMLALSPELWCESGDFDTEIYKLNVANGVLDLKTGELKPHNPEQMLTKLAPVSWAADAECKAWEEFIDQITMGDGEQAGYLQRLFGYCLSGSTQEETLPILYGNGANGKTICVGRLGKLLGEGEYALTLGTESLLASNFHGIRCDLRQLQGARVAFAIEVSQGRYFDEGVVKALTGGDWISARALRRNPVQFKPNAKILIGANTLPGFVGNDRGIRRRIQVIPFKAEFSGEVRKEELEARLDAELPGILRWAFEGFQAWLEQGLNPPESVLKATEDYFASNDHIAEYLQDRTEKVAGAEAPIGLAFDDYKNWAESVGVEALGKHRFGQLLEAKGFEKARNNSCRYWKDLALKVAI